MTLEPHPNIYLSDILYQPQALEHALARFEPHRLDPLAQGLQNGDFDRVILTGMGASLYAAYPAWLALAQSGVPALWLDTAELLHHAAGLISPRTLLWVISQSGRSAEVVALMESLRSQPAAALLATTNHLDSPLAQVAQRFSSDSCVLPIDAAVETTVSTRTYLNTLALAQLAALCLRGQALEPHLDALRFTVRGLAAYLQDWQVHLEVISERIGMPERIVLLGRGASMAAAYSGALILGEASKMLATGLQAAEFRHGPLEICSPRLTALLFAGPPETRALNRALYQELLQYQVRAFWLQSPLSQEGRGTGAEGETLRMPFAAGIGLPLAEILPIQLLTVHLCQQQGIEPGKVFFIGKVTTTE